MSFVAEIASAKESRLAVLLGWLGRRRAVRANPPAPGTMGTAKASSAKTGRLEKRPDGRGTVVGPMFMGTEEAVAALGSVANRGVGMVMAGGLGGVCQESCNCCQCWVVGWDPSIGLVSGNRVLGAGVGMGSGVCGEITCPEGGVLVSG